MFYDDSYENEYTSDNDSYNIDEEFEETYLDEPYEDDFMADTDLQFEDNADDDTSDYAVESEETVMTDEPDIDEPDEIEECTEHIDTTTYTEYEETEEEQHNDNFNSIETESEKIEEPIEAEETTESEIEEHEEHEEHEEEHEEHEEEKTVDLLKDAVVEQQSQEIEQQSQEIYSRDIEEDEHSSDTEDVDMTSNVDLHGFKDEEFEFKLDKHEEEISNDYEEPIEEHHDEQEHTEEHEINNETEEDNDDDEIIDFGDIDIEEINKSKENNNNIEEHEEPEEEIHKEIQEEPIEAEVNTDDKVEVISEYIEETDEEYEDDIKEIDNDIETFEEHEHISRENHGEILITEKDRDENLAIEENSTIEESNNIKQDNESESLDATVQYEDEKVSDNKIGHVSDEIEQQSDTTDEHNVSQYLDSKEDIELRAAGVSNLRLQEILIEKIGYMPYEVIKLSRVQMLDIISKEEKKRGNKK